MHRRISSLLALALVACAGGRPPPMAPPLPDEEERAEEGPRIAGIALPRLPVDVEPDDPLLADGWARTEDALTMPIPQPPTGEAWEVETWADEDFADWLRRRAEVISAAQHALTPAREGPARYSVVVSMLLGVAYTRFAMDLRGIPTPPVFAANEELSVVFREALESAAHSLWLRALDAFGSCSSVAAGEPAHSLDRWREACDRELRTVGRMLPDHDPDDEDDEDDEDDD